jgi:hypothetical protein
LDRPAATTAVKTRHTSRKPPMCGRFAPHIGEKRHHHRAAAEVWAILH